MSIGSSSSTRRVHGVTTFCFAVTSVLACASNDEKQIPAPATPDLSSHVAVPPANAPAPAAPAPPDITLAPVVVRGLDDRETQLVEHIETHAERALTLLRQVVDINSGTMNHDGVRAVGAIFSERLEAIGMTTHWIDQRDVNRAGHLFAEIDGGHGPRVLLIGHLDTVFEQHSPFQRYKPLSDTTVAGPGITDMKSGNVIIVQALEALHAHGLLDKMRVIVALTGDEEETGKPLSISRASLIDAAKRSDIALGFEGGATPGSNSVTIARRGFSQWTVRVRAKAGHSSRIFDEPFGAGAIFESARILQSFYSELRGQPYLTFNAGLTMGGTSIDHQPQAFRASVYGKTNVIPEHAMIVGDLRALSIEQRERAKQQMRAIVARGGLSGTTAEIAFVDSYPPMAPTEGNRTLAHKLDQVGQDLGLAPAFIVDPGRRGAADISFAAPHADSLDGLGAFGHGSHSDSETVELSSIPAATKRAAVFLYRLTRDGRVPHSERGSRGK